MIKFHRRRRAAASAAAAAALIAVLAACSSSGSSGSAGSTAGSSAQASGGSLTIGPDTGQTSISVKPDPAAIALLPASVKQSGTINVGIEANGGYPNSVQINGKQYGLTYDLARELAAALGLKANIQAGPFTDLIPGLQAGRYQLSTSLYGETAARRQVLDFVTAAYSLGNVVIAGSNSPNKHLTFSDLCGLSIGTTAASSQAALVQQASTACTKAGKPAVKIEQFDSNPDTVLAVVSNRVDGAALPMGGGTYAAKANPSLTLGPLDTQVVGYSGSALPKGSPLVPAVHAAMVDLVQDGVWKQTLTIYAQQLTMPTLTVVQKNQPYPGT
jgi:polar amino acid transport system substrate-binding protein